MEEIEAIAALAPVFASDKLGKVSPLTNRYTALIYRE